MFEIRGKYTTAKVMLDDVEESCVAQITQFVNHPAFTEPVAIMPDTHAGRGSVIGFTMPLSDKVVPATIGVDIGCSIQSVCIGKNLPCTKEYLDTEIRKRVPFGTNVREKPAISMAHDFPWPEINALASQFFRKFKERYGGVEHIAHYDMDWFKWKCEKIGAGTQRVINALGSLGGGNHFIEVGLDQSNNYWFTVHTGSRNFGKCVCDYWQTRAKYVLENDKRKELDRRVKAIRQEFKDAPKHIEEKVKEAKAALGMNIGINIKGCEWLEGDDALGYLHDMIFAQAYADVNRKVICKTIMKILGLEHPATTITSVHNFIDFKDFIIRKGAIRAYKGEHIIIPFNMRDGVLLCEGRSNKEWNYSAPHGAGRVLSRSKAKEQIRLQDYKRQMAGIYSTSVDANTLDEAPDAYKDAKVIEGAIGPTAVILNRIKPIIGMKDSSKARKYGRQKG